jgi:hypothetical protein
MIQADSMADDLGREAMAVVRVGRWLRPASLVCLASPRQTQLP